MLRLITTALILNCATFAAAGHLGGGFDGFGARGFGFGGHHGSFGDFGGIGPGLGLGIYGTERTQARFEHRFEDLMSDYEEGVAEITDFYMSDEYADIVDGTELLVDRYGFFVNGVDRNIERLTDFISIANDDLTYYNDLLTEYQADEDLSEVRLERIEHWIERITGRISMKIDRLTDVQMTLQDNLPDYLSFQTDIDTFLTDIVAAGESSEVTASTVLAFSASAETSRYDELAAMGYGMMSIASAAVPEPGATFSVLVVLSMLAMSRRRRASGT